jgi:glycosyltransferase involved in cell wall biosynthesis
MAYEFSVAMCTFNGARFIDEQLASIAAQTRLPDELIICDDCSTDQTVEIVERFARNAPFPVRLHVNPTNIGTTGNFGRAIGFCTGDLIALCDQDDVWLPTKLARLEKVFEDSPAIGLVFTDAELVDEEMRPTGLSLWEKLGVGPDSRRQLSSERAIDELITGSTVTGATAAFRSRFKSLTLPIPGDLLVIHDAWIAMLISAVARVSPLSERLVKYRQHATQQIGALERRSAPRGLLSQSPIDSLRRDDFYLEAVRTMKAVRQRLVEHSNDFELGGAVRLLEERIDHLDARVGLPQSRIMRAPRVLRELITGRYHRYSNGAYSAMKDLIA